MIWDGPLKIIRSVLMFVVIAALLGPAILPQPTLAAEPEFNFSPKAGPPGTKVTVTASNLPPNEQIVVKGDGKTLCSFTSGSNGKGTCSFKVPKGRSFSIILTGPNVSRSEIGTFKVTNGGGDKKGSGGGHGGRSNGQRGDNGGNSRQGGHGGVLDRVLHPAGHCADDPEACRRFADEAENARRVGDCLVGGVPFFGCHLPGDETPPDPIASSLDCLSTGLSLLVNPLALGALLLGACDIPVDTGPLAAPPLTDPSDADCAFGQPSASSPACLGPTTPSGGNLTQVSPQPELGPDAPSVSSEDYPTFGDILDQFGANTSEPSASMVQDQQNEIRGEVCASVPTGAGGCP
jgi:hypothetical protein